MMLGSADSFDQLRADAAAYYAFHELPEDKYYAVSAYVAAHIESWSEAELRSAYGAALYAKKVRRSMWTKIACATALLLVGLSLLSYTIPKPIDERTWYSLWAIVGVTALLGLLQKAGWDIERSREGEWRRTSQEILKEMRKRGFVS